MRRLQLRVNECVVLRQIAEEDAEEISALIDRNRVHLREWLPWLDNSNGIHDTARFIGRSLEQAADDNGFTFAIVCDGVLTGVIGQHYLDSLNRRTELGYWLDALHQGRGIVTQSTARLTDYAFTEQACNRVILHCALQPQKPGCGRTPWLRSGRYSARSRVALRSLRGFGGLLDAEIPLGTAAFRFVLP